MAGNLIEFTVPKDSKRSPESIRVDLSGSDTAMWTDHVMLEGSKMTVVIVGQYGAGKSAIANRVLGLSNGHLKNSCKFQATSKHGLMIEVAETSNIQDIRGKTGLLMYCIPVDPSSRFEGNSAIMRSLQDVFGKDIWKRCMVIFTFSNYAWDRLVQTCKNKDEVISKFKEHIGSYVAKFTEELQTLEVADISVKTIFDDLSEPTPDGKTTLLAIPAGERPDDPVLPGFDCLSTKLTIVDSTQPEKQVKLGARDWRDVVFIEMVKKYRRTLNHDGPLFGLSNTRGDEVSSTQQQRRPSLFRVMVKWAIVGAILGVIIALSYIRGDEISLLSNFSLFRVAINWAVIGAILGATAGATLAVARAILQAILPIVVKFLFGKQKPKNSKRK